ncbi:hypothetical protein FRC06_006814 [Ceratobasidium sp. 370]|nr:hypothetical protein FRC06_006814 [Ceratobasidium sp. 370]
MRVITLNYNPLECGCLFQEGDFDECCRHCELVGLASLADYEAGVGADDGFWYLWGDKAWKIPELKRQASRGQGEAQDRPHLDNYLQELVGGEAPWLTLDKGHREAKAEKRVAPERHVASSSSSSKGKDRTGWGIFFDRPNLASHLHELGEEAPWLTPNENRRGIEAAKWVHPRGKGKGRMHPYAREKGFGK